MNLLTSSLPHTVNINGAEYPINTDFRTSVLFEQIVFSNLIDEQTAIRKTLELYYPTIPFHVPLAIEKVMWFYKCGKEDTDTATSSCGSNKRVYSFEYDDEYIYAAFLDQYGIDLQETSLHWWKFRALFHALKEDNMIVKIMGYRAIDINEKMSKKEKSFYRAMKKQYAIPLPKSEREKLDSVQDILLNGGNLSNING